MKFRNFIVPLLIAVLGIVVAPTQAHAVSLDKCASGSYKNSNGNCVHGPSKAPSWPAGASAECRDQTYSYSQHRSGTCSHHGGVLKWAA